MQHVKAIGDDSFRTSALAECRLKRLKTTLSFGIEKHRFHIEYGGLDVQSFQRRGDRRKTFRPVIPVARLQARVTAGDEPEQPVAIELDLVDPLLAFRRFID